MFAAYAAVSCSTNSKGAAVAEPFVALIAP